MDSGGKHSGGRMPGALKRALVLGHTGLVGGAVVGSCPVQCLTPPPRGPDFDLARPETLGRVIRQAGPDLVINCAALSNLEQCEQEPDLAWAVNALAPEEMAQACAEIGAGFIHLSTDYVFNGALGRPYLETDATAPLSAYARAKLAGEERALAAWRRTLVARVAWVFGPARPTFVDLVVDRARHGLPVYGARDMVGSPTYTLDLAPALWELGARGVSGVVHLVNQGRTSRYELGRRALALAGLDPEALEPVSMADLGFKAARPGFSVLDTARLAKVLGRRLPVWTDALTRHIARRLEPAQAGRGRGD
jgi:dTDP-4-dehydrorhamnose reductase